MTGNAFALVQSEAASVAGPRRAVDNTVLFAGGITGGRRGLPAAAGVDVDRRLASEVLWSRVRRGR